MTESVSASWSVVLPYYNEAQYLPTTLKSLANQTLRPVKLILVNNASTDGSLELAREALAGAEGIQAVYIDEPRPGQVHALEAGIDQVDTEFVAICDADTIYPPNYLSGADGLFRESGDDVVAVLAIGVAGDPAAPRNRFVRMKTAFMGALLSRQCHSGGYAHAFRTSALKKAGGYSKSRWPYVLKDHELMHRVNKLGRTRYDPTHICQASDRREDRGAVRWTLSERLLYHVTPYALKDWFFYTFLAARMERRKMDELSLRDRPWERESASTAND